MIEYNEGSWIILLLFRLKGSVAPRALCYALPAASLTLVGPHLGRFIEGYQHDTLVGDLSAGYSWNASVWALVILLVFRVSQALRRFWEGTTLLHMMQGEWFDSVSCLFTFSRGARTTKAVESARFRQTLVRLMSMLSAAAIEELKSNDVAYKVFDIHGFDDGTLGYLQESAVLGFDKVTVILHMVQVLMTHNLDTGVLSVPPPVLTRVYQTLSRGFVNFLDAKKIADTMFPFPFAQTIAMLLLFHSFFIPIVVTSFISNPVWAFVVSFLPLFGAYSLNFVSIELEMPFGDDDNDLPMIEFQDEVNKSLHMLIIGDGPGDIGDFLPGCTPEAVAHDGEKLLEALLAGKQVRSTAKFIDEGEYELREEHEELCSKAASVRSVVDADDLPPPPRPACEGADTLASALAMLQDLADQCDASAVDQFQASADHKHVLQGFNANLEMLIETLETRMADFDKTCANWDVRLKGQSVTADFVATSLRDSLAELRPRPALACFAASPPPRAGRAAASKSADVSVPL